MKWLNDVADWLNDRISDLVSSRWWGPGVILITFAWMAVEWVAPHSIDKPDAFYPLTVLFYTLIGLWIENSQKRVQAIQHELAMRQMAKLEQLVAEGAKRDEQMIQLLRHQSHFDREMQSMVNLIDATLDEVLRRLGGDPVDDI